MKKIIIKQINFVFLVVLMLFFVGCFPMFPIRHQSRIYEKNVKKIEMGLTKAKVYDLLGKPNFLENDRYCVYEVEGWHGGVAIIGPGDGFLIDFGTEIHRILLEFNKNDKVINKEVEEGLLPKMSERVHVPYLRIAISPNGKNLAVIRSCENFFSIVNKLGYKVLLIDLETKEKVEYDKKDVGSTDYNVPIKPEFSPDSKYLVLIGHYVKVIDVSNPSKTFLFKGHGEFSFWSWNPRRVECLAFFPDGKKVATGGSRGFIKIWELSTGTEIKTINTHNGEVDSIEISPDGKFIIAGLDDNLRIFDSTTGNEIMTFKTHEKKVDSIEISPNGKFIATGSGTNIRIFDSTTGNELYQMISEIDSHDLMDKQCLFKFSPDGKSFAVNRGTHIELWSINQERGDSGLNSKGIFKGLADVFLLPVFDERLIRFAHPSLDFSNDSKIVAASYGSIIIYNLQNREKLWSYNLKSMPPSPNEILIKYAALHPNGKLLFIYTGKEISRVDLEQEK